MWFDGPMDNADDHQQRHRRPDRRRRSTSTPASPNSVVSNNFIRNTGDDGLAMWSETTAERRTTRSTTTRCRRRSLANGIAIYGGTRQHGVEQPRRRPDPRGQRPARRLPLRRRAVRRAPVDHQQHHGPRRHVRAELEHRPRRDLDLRAGEEHRRGHPGGRGQLPRQHLQRDHAGQRLAGEGPVLDHERPLQGHPGRRHGHLGGQRPRRRVGVVRERGRPQRRRRRRQQLRVVPLHAGRLGVLARPTSAATTAAAPPGPGSRRGSCRTPSPATTARRSSRRRRPSPW